MRPLRRRVIQEAEIAEAIARLLDLLDFHYVQALVVLPLV